MNIYKVTLRDTAYDSKHLTIQRASLTSAVEAIAYLLNDPKVSKGLAEVNIKFDSKVDDV